MSRSVYSAVLLVALILLAGCSGFSVLEPDTSEVSVTPAAVPTDDPTATPNDQIAPGVLPTGVYNASMLVNAHTRILGSTSFTVEIHHTFRYANGTLARRTTTIQRVESGPPSRILSHFRYHQQRLYPQRSNRSPVLARDIWYKSDNGYIRATYANNTTRYSAFSTKSYDSNPFAFIPMRIINRSLSDVDTQVTRLTRNGTTYYRIEGSLSHENRGFSNSFKNTSQWLLIDSRGVIHEYHYSATLPSDGNVSMINKFSMTFRKIGNTTVERPAWVETARNRTTPTNRTETVSQ